MILWAIFTEKPTHALHLSGLRLSMSLRHSQPASACRGAHGTAPKAKGQAAARRATIQGDVHEGM